MFLDSRLRGNDKGAVVPGIYYPFSFVQDRFTNYDLRFDFCIARRIAYCEIRTRRV